MHTATIAALLLATAALPLASAQAQAQAQDKRPASEATVKLSPAQLEKIRLEEIARAARLYTAIAFSPAAIARMRDQLPLPEAAFQSAIIGVRNRFEACMEGGFEARLDDAYTAQVLRKTMQNARTRRTPEPRDARSVLPAFTSTNKYCAGRIKAWMASQIQ